MQHPQRLGKYQITEVLGEGAMGVVYKGFDPDIQRVVALKTIRRDFIDESHAGAMAAARFRNEAQAAGRLSHPGIVAVYDYGEDNGVAYIAMEFVQGESLADLLSRGVRFTDHDIAGLMKQLLDALHHAHEGGVWHRDIKPANVILARNARLKVADFGIARIESAELTRMNVMIGTPAYMAPEQFIGDPIDRRVDVYAAGVLLYALLVGRPPFSGSTEALMYKAVHEAPKLPSSIDGLNRPRFYDALLTRALAKAPDDRFATAAEFQRALRDAVGDIDDTGWEKTVIAAATLARPKAAAAAPSVAAQSSSAGGTSGTGGTGGTGATPTHWDRSELQKAEASLARYVGPLASVLVRRAARECDTLGALYQRLADQVSDPTARAAFLGQVYATQFSSGTRATSVTSVATQLTRSAASAPGQPLAEALVENARKLVSQHLGPIATVVVKRAAAGKPDRQQFFQTLADAVPQPQAKQKLLDDLNKLG